MDKKMAREIVESLPSLYPSMSAEEEEAIWALLATDKNVGSNEDCINRKQALAILYDFAGCIVDTPNGDYHKAYKKYHDMMEQLPPAQPETATVTIGRTKGSITMWYECDACGEPVDQNDNYCRNCGRKLKHE